MSRKETFFACLALLIAIPAAILKTVGLNVRAITQSNQDLMSTTRMASLLIPRNSLQNKPRRAQADMTDVADRGQTAMEVAGDAEAIEAEAEVLSQVAQSLDVASDIASNLYWMERPMPEHHRAALKLQAAQRKKETKNTLDALVRAKSDRLECILRPSLGTWCARDLLR